MSNLREMIGGNELVEAPVVFNPLTAKLAEAAGFPALYLGGGTLGYVQCVTEANLTLTEMVRPGPRPGQGELRLQISRKLAHCRVRSGPHLQSFLQDNP